MQLSATPSLLKLPIWRTINGSLWSVRCSSHVTTWTCLHRSWTQSPSTQIHRRLSLKLTKKSRS